MQGQGSMRSALQWCWPRACSLCGGTETASDPCPDCAQCFNEVRLTNVCPGCALPFSAPRSATPTAEPAFCPTCTARSLPFDRVIAPWAFVPPVSPLVHRMKYGRDLAMTATLGGLFARELKALPGLGAPDAIIAMPMSRRRLLARGFNHAEEIAMDVRRALGAERVRGVRIHRRHSPPQVSSHSVQERRANVAGVFEIREWPAAYRRVAIVDDVLTTGATMEALAQALRAQGVVERIEVWCCARTPLPPGSGGQAGL